jgi:hypothetical protein
MYNSGSLEGLHVKIMARDETYLFRRSRRCIALDIILCKDKLNIRVRRNGVHDGNDEIITISETYELSVFICT